MKQTWQQKTEAINRLSPSTVSLEGSSFPSGLLLVQQSFMRFQETLCSPLSIPRKNIFHCLQSLTVSIPRSRREREILTQ